jgi:hypothetical protein
VPFPPFSDQMDNIPSVPVPSLPQRETRATGFAATASWSGAAVHDLASAILRTVVYADLFDYPLKIEEIHRYLTGYSAPLATVEKHLEQGSRLDGHLTSAPPFWFLAGREHLVSLRREREAFSLVLWQQAKRYGRLIAAIPFVRMVSITGSLAMNNVSGPKDDIDLLIVTARNRVWLGRGLVILIVHLARCFRVEICPNYVIAEHRLELGEPGLFTAHELAQLIPLYGLDIYHRLLQRNAWMTAFLPNASPRQASVREIGVGVQFGQRALEGLLGGRLGDALEHWERERKIPRLHQVASEKGGSGTSYTPDLCKGHANDHAASVYQQYAARLAAERR